VLGRPAGSVLGNEDGAFSMLTSALVQPVNPSGRWGDPHVLTCVVPKGIPRPPPVAANMVTASSAEVSTARLRCLIGHRREGDNVFWHFCFDPTSPVPAPRDSAVTWLGTELCSTKLLWRTFNLRSIQVNLNQLFFQNLQKHQDAALAFHEGRYQASLKLEPTFYLTLTLQSIFPLSLSKDIAQWKSNAPPLPKLL